MIRKKNLYSRPRKMFEAERIREENQLVKQYGLKNKTEIWKTLAKVNYYRNRAMALAKRPLEEQEVLFKKLRSLGLKANTASDVLGLKVEDLLKRRLPTIVAKKKLARTVQQARQLIVHKKITVNSNVLNVPSYLVPVDEEPAISIKIKKAAAPEKRAEQSASEEKGDNE